MKKLTYTFCLAAFMFCLKPQAQITALDSIKNLLESHSSGDTTYLDLRIKYIDLKIYNDPGDTSLLSFTEETLRIAEKLNYTEGKILSLQKYGIILQYFKGKPLEAIDYYQEALRLIDKNPRHKKHAYSSRANIASIYYEQQEYEKALDLYMQLYQEFKAITIVEQYLGNVYGELEEYDSSIFFFKKAITKADSAKNYAVQANCLAGLSLIYIRIKEPELAVQHIEESINLIDKYGLDILRLAVYTNACEAYLLNENYQKAEKLAKETLNFEPMVSNLYMKKSLYGTLYNVYKSTSQYDKALSAYEEFVILNDSLRSQDRQLEVSRKEMAFEAERKQLLAQAEIDRQKLEKNIFISSGGALMFFLLVGFVMYRQKNLERTRASEADFRRGLAESKLTALRAQLNPHFIFNALNAIDNYMNEAGVEKASAYLAKFSTLMRSILDNSDKNWVTLEEELDLMRLYLDIELLRMKDKLSYTIQVDPEVDGSNVLVPSLFLQPFIENSIGHGITKNPSGGKVDIRIERREQELVCIVEDNGPGLANDHKEGSKGLYIGSSRIDYIKQVTKGESYFDIINKEPGVRVTIRIPYKTEF